MKRRIERNLRKLILNFKKLVKCKDVYFCRMLILSIKTVIDHFLHLSAKRVLN
jgi:hypothetical protein